MASSKQLIGMIRSHAAGDDSSFLAIAEHIALDAEKAGRTRMAGELLDLIKNLRTETETRRPATRPTPISAPRGELAGLMRAAYPMARLSDLVLPEPLDVRIKGILREHDARETLANHGLTPRRKLLLSGPPGTGKTTTAAVLAGELGLPLFTIMLDGVITKYMGETAAKLRLIFDAVQSVRGVYLFDEVDALATSRGADNDIGEARRMLNSLLQFLDEDASGSILIAATNHPGLLDSAIFRRFDAALVYQHPTSSEIEQVLRANLPQFELGDVVWDRITSAAAGLSQADLAAAAKDAARYAVLDNDGVIETSNLAQSITDRAQLHSNSTT